MSQGGENDAPVTPRVGPDPQALGETRHPLVRERKHQASKREGASRHARGSHDELQQRQRGIDVPEVLVGVGGRPTEGEGVHPVEQRAVVLAAGSGGSDRRDPIRPTAGPRRPAGPEHGGPLAQAGALRLRHPPPPPPTAARAAAAVATAWTRNQLGADGAPAVAAATESAPTQSSVAVASNNWM